MVEKQGNLSAGRQVAEVGHARIHVPLVHIPPPAYARELADALGLARREDRELDPMLRQDFQGGNIHGRLRQPHPFRLPFEAPPEILDPPDHLRLFVVGVGQGHHHVIVRLSHRTAVSGELLAAPPVGLQHLRIGIRGVRFQPVHERRAKIEADTLVIVDDVDDLLVRAENTGSRILPVTFLGDPGIPVVVWIRRILQLDVLEPRILSGWLIEVPVYTNVFIHPVTFLSCVRHKMGNCPFVACP